MTETLRVGVVGAGMIANVHVNAYSVTPGVEVVAVADPVASKAEQLAERVGAAVVPDLEAVLGLGVDIVSVCTPPPTHADLAVRALEAGRHVMCEKPIGRRLPDARRIVEAGERADGLLMIGHVSRFEPDHAQAKSLVDGGMVGDVRLVKHSITTSLPGWSEGGWLADPEVSGGPLIDLSVHSFDYLAWVIGSPAVRVTAVAADSGTGPSTFCLVTVRYENGAMGLVECSWAHPPARGFKLLTEIVGTEGRIGWDYDHLMGGVLYPTEGSPSWYDPLGERGFAGEMRAFTEAVRRGGPAPVSAREGYQALRTALAAAESIATGETIDLTTWGAL